MPATSSPPLTLMTIFCGNGWSGGPLVAGDHLFRDRPLLVILINLWGYFLVPYTGSGGVKQSLVNFQSDKLIDPI